MPAFSVMKKIFSMTPSMTTTETSAVSFLHVNKLLNSILIDCHDGNIGDLSDPEEYSLPPPEDDEYFDEDDLPPPDDEGSVLLT